MSTSIDNRAVQLGFENRQFESGVKSSLDSLSALKKGLDLTESAKSLDKLATSGKSFSLGPIGEGVQSISNRFSALGIIGMTVIQNLTTYVMGLTKKLVEAAVGVDGIKAGFAEYELKLGSIQTIMAGTGESLSTVNKYLNDLNDYSDKTIYSFSDMTTNIGKFTNAGVSLKDSVAAIQGIANAAALSGSNAGEAARAMYNFAQALSSGYVKLMDWKSIELANMATVEFKTQLLETAVATGTLTKTADGMYKTLGGTVISATKGFNDSLQEQWMTTEALTKTLGKYADETTDIGKRAFAAAQDVKTYSQLMGTLKEAVGSGWAQSWEIVIGNFDEAKGLFTEINTVLGGMVVASADARNKTLLQWKDFGGRLMLVETLRNAFADITAAIQPVKDAFREIFPPTKSAGLILWKLTFIFWNLSKSLKMGGETADKVKRIFKGLFAFLDILRMGFVGLWGIFAKLISNFSGAGDGALEFLAKIGDFVVRIRDAIKAGNLFAGTIDKMTDFVQNGVAPFQEFSSKIGLEFGKLQDPIDTFKKKFQELFDFKKIDFSGIDKFFEKIKIRFAPLELIVKVVAVVIGGMIKLLQLAVPLLEKVAPGLTKTLSAIASAIGEGVRTLDFSKLFDIINTGLLATLILAIKNFLGKGGGALDGIGGMFGGVTKVLDGVRGSLEAYQKNLQAKTLLLIAVAIGVLVASLVVLSMIDSKKLTSSILAVTALFAELTTSMAIMGKTSGGLLGGGGAAVTLMGVAVALLLLTVALKSLADMDPEAMQNGLIALGALTTSLAVFVKLVSSTSSSFVGGAISLMLLGVALKIMVGVVKDLGTMDVETLRNGLISIGVILGELVIFMKASNIDKMGVTKGLGLIALAAALLLMSISVEKLGTMDPATLQQGLIAIGAVLAELSAFVILTQSGKGVLTTALGMVIMAASMLIFADAIKKMGDLSVDQITKGLITMGSALLLIAAGMNLMPGNMILSSIGLVLVGAALLILAEALEKLGNLSWKQLTKGLVALAASLGIIALGMIAMQGALPGAAALLVVAGALSVLTPVLKQLGSMSISELTRALIALSAVFLIFGVAGLILGPLVPVLMGLSVAIALLGVAIALIGVGILAFSVGMGTLAISGAAGAIAFVAMIGTISAAVPLLIKTIGDALIQLIGIIGAAAPAIVDAFVAILLALLQSIPKLVPDLVTAITTLLQALFKIINDNIPGFVDCVFNIVLAVLLFLKSIVPVIVQSAFDMLISFLSGIADNLPKVVETVGKIITSFLEAIGEEVPKIVDAGYKMLIALITGITAAINENQGPLNAAITDLAKAIITGLTDGLFGGLGDIIKAVENIGSGVIKALKTLLGIASPSKVTTKIGKQFDKGLVKGVESGEDSVFDAVQNLGETALSGFASAMSAIDNAMSMNLDSYPSITPIVDLSDVLASGKDMESVFGNANLTMFGSLSKLSAAAASMLGINPEGSTGTTPTSSVTFNQNNYSPKALSPSEIYRQTRNQLLMEKGLVGAT